VPSDTACLASSSVSREREYVHTCLNTLEHTCTSRRSPRTRTARTPTKAKVRPSALAAASVQWAHIDARVCDTAAGLAGIALRSKMSGYRGPGKARSKIGCMRVSSVGVRNLAACVGSALQP
jgi:hypothetical protein